MVEVKAYAPGTFCWVDLATSNLAAAKSFYRSLLEWNVQDLAGAQLGAYTMARKLERKVAGLYQQAPEHVAQGEPPRWISHIAVASAEVTVRRARHLGSKLLIAPFSVLDLGRAALMRDPTGAVFALWEPRAHPGAELIAEPGALAWNELLTKDIDRAGRFYSRLFDWDARIERAGSYSHTLFVREGQSIAGMRELPASESASPDEPEWRVYFCVSDCDDCLARGRALGATTWTSPIEAPTLGRFGSLRDPQGAAFSVLRLAPNVLSQS